MKSDVKSSVIQMNDESFKELVTEVRETIAVVNFSQPTTRSFGLVDMWNIRRNARSASSLVRF